MLERFMKELAKFEYLTQSREFKVFTRERGDLEKILQSMLKQSPIQIIEKYRQNFNINEEQDVGDLAQYKENIINFQGFLRKAVPVMEIQKKQLKKMVAVRDEQNQAYITTVQGLIKYEDNNTEYVSESDVTKRILTNPATGSEFNEKFTTQWKTMRNPYKETYYWLKGELLDLKGLKSALEGRENVVKLQSAAESKKRSDQQELEKLS